MTQIRDVQREATVRVYAPSIVEALGLIVIGAPVLSWIHDGGIQDLLAGSWSSVGRLTGLVAGALLLVQVTAMARVPFIESAIGHDRLTAWHRLAGFTSFWLIVVHLVTVTLGEGTGGFLPAMVDMGLHLPGMVLAWASLACIIAVIVTSVRSARRSLRYENWHLIHLYGYLGAFLAVPHMIWVGTDVTGVVRDLWLLAWLTMALLVVVYRVAVPLIRSSRASLRVGRVRPVGARGVEVSLVGRTDVLRAKAGQFLILRFADPGVTRGLPLSISSDPAWNLTVTAAIVGPKTERLTSLAPGTRAYVEGPYGTMTWDRRTSDAVVLMGSGSGVMPIKSLLEALPEVVRATVILRSRVGECFYREEFEELCRSKDVALYVLEGSHADTDRGPSWQAAIRGTSVPSIAADDTEALARLVPDLESSDLYVCGPDGWMGAVVAAARRGGVSREAIHAERFG